MEEFDFSEFEDDGSEIFEESNCPLSASRSYPSPCQVLFSYKVVKEHW